MSIETANAARFKKGISVLTPLEGELLGALEKTKGALEALRDSGIDIEMQDYDAIDEADHALAKACGETP